MRMRRLKKFDERKDAVQSILLRPEIGEKRYDADTAPEYLDTNELFGNDNPIYIEVGCGMGGFAVEFAKRNPDINLIAVEINENVIIKACEHTIVAGVDNVRYLCISANYLDRYIKPDSVSGIILNFSCPYPKKRYAAHRLTAPVFLNIYKKILKNGAKIAQKTDNMHFFEYSIEQYSKCGFLLSEVSLDLHNSGFEGNIITEYEQKFLSQGLPIYRLVAECTK